MACEFWPTCLGVMWAGAYSHDAQRVLCDVAMAAADLQQTCSHMYNVHSQDGVLERQVV
jgi:hypothetical protein